MTVGTLPEGILRMFGEHLVVCNYFYQHLDDEGNLTGKVHCQIFSGLVMSFRGIWFYTTAGHSLKDLQTVVQHLKIKLLKCIFVDSYGTHAVHGTDVQFLVEGRPMFFVDDDSEGLDFGMVPLSYFEQRCLKANKIRPVEEANWNRQHTVEFQSYFLFGAPEENAPKMYDENSLQTPILVSLFKVHPIEQPVSVVSERPWLTYHIPEKYPVKSIIGMSGGPVFGIRRSDDGTGQYWVVAIQSWWQRDDRLAFACRLPSFSRIFDAILEEIFTDDRLVPPDSDGA